MVETPHYRPSGMVHPKTVTLSLQMYIGNEPIFFANERRLLPYITWKDQVLEPLTSMQPIMMDCYKNNDKSKMLNAGKHLLNVKYKQ